MTVVFAGALGPAFWPRPQLNRPRPLALSVDYTAFLEFIERAAPDMPAVDRPIVFQHFKERAEAAALRAIGVAQAEIVAEYIEVAECCDRELREWLASLPENKCAPPLAATGSRA